MKTIRVITVHGQPFRRCGREFSKAPTTLTVGEGGDLSDEDYEWLRKAAVPSPVQVRHGEPPEEGGVLDIVELAGGRATERVPEPPPEGKETKGYQRK